MASISSNGYRREPYATAPTPTERRLLALLLAQDGSTTRLCEAVAGGPVSVLLHGQEVVGEVPGPVRARLPGEAFIRRVTSLVAQGQVLMDNLSYIALQGLEPDVEADLRAGVMPIGHLLARWWVRRDRLTPADLLLQPLWQVVGLPDPDAARAYVIVTPAGPRMVIAEAFRRGMLMERG